MIGGEHIHFFHQYAISESAPPRARQAANHESGTMMAQIAGELTRLGAVSPLVREGLSADNMGRRFLMGLKHMMGIGKVSAEEDEPSAAPADRCLSLLGEGAALNMPEIDSETYKKFRASVSGMAMQVPDRLPVADKLAQIQLILRQFESYRKDSEGEIRNRQTGWRALTLTLLQEMLSGMGIGAASPEEAPLLNQVGNLTTAADIQAYRDQLALFLHPAGVGSKALKASPLTVADRSTVNDNAAGLRGGGDAVAHVKRIMERGGQGFIALLRLSCLEVIRQRYGLDTVHDSLMAVAAFLTQSLRSDDAIYHWSDSSLLAVLQGRTSEQTMTAELQRSVSQNREISVNVGERSIMLRIPITFELTAIDKLRTADDLYKLK